LTRRGPLSIVSGSSMSHECFADEIAIDFPSVEPALERMRDAFLGERSGSDVDVLHREVLVSRREAWDGVVVPVDVPIRGMCPDCGGRGEVWTEPCDECRGTGASLFHHAVRVPLPPGVTDGARVRFRVSSPGSDSVRVELRVAIANRVTE
jgi:hypothetical protein